MSTQFRVFVSFAESDQSIAERVLARLEREGFAVWNPLQLSPGGNWPLETGRALGNANALVVLVSPDAVRSRSLRGEVDYALSGRQFAHSLWPVIVRSTPKADIPWIWNRMPVIDMVEDPERGLDRLVQALKSRQAGPASAT